MTAASAPTLAAPDDDPWLWLEEVDGARATAWADAQTAATAARFGGARFAADRDTLRALLDRPDNLAGAGPARRAAVQFLAATRRIRAACGAAPRSPPSAPTRRNGTCCSTWTRWPRRRLRTGCGMGASTLPPDHGRALVRLSRGGSDAAVLREFDLATRQFVPGGFTLAEAKGGAAWLDADTLLLSSTGPGGVLGTTASGYASTVRLWRRGEAPGAPLFTAEPGEHERVPASTTARPTGWCSPARSTSTAPSCSSATAPGPASWIEPAGRRRDSCGDGGWLAVRPRSPWTVGARHLPARTRVLGIGLDAFLAGDRGFTVLFDAAARAGRCKASAGSAAPCC